MEYVFEFFIELLFDLYQEIVSYFLPNKQISKLFRVILRVVCAVVSIINVALVFAGVWFITENVITLGIVLTAIGATLIVAHVVLAIILKNK